MYSMQRIVSKSQDRLYEFPHWVMVTQYLALWCNSYVYAAMVISCSRWLCGH